MAFGLAETAKLAVDLSLKGNFASSLGASTKALGRFDKSITNTQGRAYKAGQQIGTGIKSGAVIAAGGIAFLITQVGAGIRQLAVLETATAQTNAVIKSTKGVAGETADAIRNLAEKYEGLNATIDDKVIQSGENLLLTFTNIRKEAFEPALEAALNLNTRLGGGEGGLQNTIKLLGKALNDPLKGLGALSKAGITFNAQQTDQIKTLIKNNDLLGAQDLILKELGKRYGGAFAAEGKTAQGTLSGIGDAVEDLQKALATGLFPVVQKVLPKIRSALADPKVIAEITKIGNSIAGLFSDQNLAEGGKLLGTIFDTAKAAAPVIKSAAGATLEIIKAAVSLFKSLPPELQSLAVGAFAVNKLTGGLVTNIGGALAGGLASFLAKSFTGGMNVNAGVVNVNGAGGLAGGAGAVGGGKSTVGKVVSAASKVFIVGAAIGVFAELTSILRDQSTANKEIASNLAQQTQQFTGGASLGDLKNSLAGLDQQIADLKGFRDVGASLAFSADIDGVRTAINNSRSALVAAITREEQKSAAAQVHAVERAEAIASGKADQIKRAQAAAAIAVRRVEAAENRQAPAIVRGLGARINAAKAAIDAAKAKASADTRSETAGIRAAIKAQKLAVSIATTNRISVTNGAITKAQTTYKKMSGFVW